LAEILLFPDIPRMGKTLSRWRITRIRGNRIQWLDVVGAPSAEEARKQIIETLQITDRLEQKRIGAMPYE